MWMGTDSQRTERTASEAGRGRRARMRVEMGRKEGGRR